MALVLGVNSYATVQEADLYFQDRIDVAAWTNAADDMKAQALVTATKLFDGYSYAGQSAERTQILAWPRVGSVYLGSRGLYLSFTKDYNWDSDADTSESMVGDFVRSFSKLPLEIQYLKTAVFEQAYHLVNNDGILDSVASPPSEITVGPISIGDSSPPPIRSAIAYSYIRPLLNVGSSNIWFRAN